MTGLLNALTTGNPFWGQFYWMIVYGGIFGALKGLTQNGRTNFSAHYFFWHGISLNLHLGVRNVMACLSGTFNIYRWDFSCGTKHFFSPLQDCFCLREVLSAESGGPQKKKWCTYLCIIARAQGYSLGIHFCPGGAHVSLELRALVAARMCRLRWSRSRGGGGGTRLTCDFSCTLSLVTRCFGKKLRLWLKYTRYQSMLLFRRATYFGRNRKNLARHQC